MNLLNIKKIIKIFILVSCFFPVFSLALTLSPDTDMVVKIKPEFPRANEFVSLSLESYLVDLNKSEINWYKNGVLERSGLGEKGFSFKTRGLGSSENILIEVVSGGFVAISENITIQPAEVDLIWEADSFTPPFYKGKALNSNQSEVKIIAIPDFITSSGLKINSSNLVYKWRKDWKVLGSESGVGKNILILNRSSSFRDSNIVVDVESLDGSLKAQRLIVVSSYDPKIVFYKKDSLLGTIFNKTISNQFNLLEEETALVAYPLFFSKKDSSGGNLEYNWTMNNKKINNINNTIVLRQEGDFSGTSRIGLEIKNTDKIMQYVKKRFDVIFGGSETSVFGN